jgi:hypothetical protein
MAFLIRRKPDDRISLRFDEMFCQELAPDFMSFEKHRRRHETSLAKLTPHLGNERSIIG